MLGGMLDFVRGIDRYFERYRAYNLSKGNAELRNSL